MSPLDLQPKDALLSSPVLTTAPPYFWVPRTTFETYFGQNPSQAWTSIGYSERGDSILSDGDTRSFSQGGQSFAELAEIYGEENARYLFDALTAHHDAKEIPFLDVPETHIPAIFERIQSSVQDSGKNLQPLSGKHRASLKN